MPECPYCSVPSEDAWIAVGDAVAVPHPRPIVTCHIVVAPRRHVPSFYDLDVQEQSVVWGLITEIRQRLVRSMRIDGFAIGFADFPGGAEAHTHIHIVPRIPGEKVVLPAGIEWVDPSGQ